MPWISAKPLQLTGYLRRPAGPGPFPAVVLLPGCAGPARSIDRRWGTRLAGWGDVALSVDSLGLRGLDNVCARGEERGFIAAFQPFWPMLRGRTA
jgi:dienelactone hydrolase